MAAPRALFSGRNRRRGRKSSRQRIREKLRASGEPDADPRFPWRNIPAPFSLASPGLSPWRPPSAAVTLRRAAALVSAPCQAPCCLPSTYVGLFYCRFYTNQMQLIIRNRADTRPSRPRSPHLHPTVRKGQLEDTSVSRG